MTLTVLLYIICLQPLLSSTPTVQQDLRPSCSECSDPSFGSLTMCMYHHRIMRFGQCQHAKCTIPASAVGQVYCLNHGGKRDPPAPVQAEEATQVQPVQKRARVIIHPREWPRPSFIASLAMIPEGDAVEVPMPVRIKRSAAYADLSEAHAKRANLAVLGQSST